VIEYNTKLANEAAELLVDMLGTKKFEVPKDMEAPNLRMIRLPDFKKYPIRKEIPGDLTVSISLTIYHKTFLSYFFLCLDYFGRHGRIAGHPL
jgi:hypothetical protein